MSGSVSLVGVAPRPSKTAGKAFDIPKALVVEAWERVRSNKGAPGVDGAAVEDFERDLQANLYKICKPDVLGQLLPASGASGSDPQA